MGISKVLVGTLLLVTAACTAMAIRPSEHRGTTTPIRANIAPVLGIPAVGASPPSPSSSSTQSKSSDQSHSADFLQQAESLLEKQQYAEAELQLQSLSKTQSTNPQVWFDLGFAESHLGKNDDAIAAYKKASELSPKWFEANLNLGLALAQAGNFSQAATALRAATELKPTTGGQQALGNAWFSLAQVLEESSPKEALEDYQKAAELNPGNAEAILGAGKLLDAQGDAAGAEKQFLAAAQMGNNRGVERLVDFYLKQKRLADAETWLRKYLASNPQNVAAQAQLGRILAAQGKTQEAITALEAVNNTSPDPAISGELAALYLDGKQYDAAAKILQDLVQKNPNDAQLHSNFGTAQLHQRKYPEAEAEFIKALNLNPKLDEAYWELAYAAQQNKHYELAIRALDARAQHLPETASTYWIRAVSYDSLGAFKPAAQNYKLFLAADAGKSPDEEFKARHRLKAIEH
ncbi:MAG TPA: tetratricopeptide repeat protein [Candidatus Angelobacter sp.]